MPPKKKVNKKKDGKDKEKKAVMVDGLPADQMNPEQLLDYIERLREEVDRERREELDSVGERQGQHVLGDLQTAA